MFATGLKGRHARYIRPLGLQRPLQFTPSRHNKFIGSRRSSKVLPYRLEKTYGILHRYRPPGEVLDCTGLMKRLSRTRLQSKLDLLKQE